MHLDHIIPPEKVNHQALKAVHEQALHQLNEERYAKYKLALEQLHELEALRSDDYLITDGVIKMGLSPNAQQKETLQNIIKTFIPWRKGPFELCDQVVDAEWKSDLKWNRLKKQVGSLQGKSILDIGCNNGYFLYQIAKQNPKYLLGIDPVIPYYCQYRLLHTLCPAKNTDFLLAGVEDLPHFEKTFDVIFCMGIIYHHQDPLGILKTIFKCLRPGGLLIMESQGIGHDDPLILMPKNRYLGMPGHWFLPSASALENMLSRTGFQYIETFEKQALSNQEQRATSYSPHNSLDDGLDPNDPSKTIEGHPAPWRIYTKARRARIRR